MDTILTLVSYCPCCHERGHPFIGQEFLVFGTSSKRFRVYKAERKGQRGFTPTIVRLKKSVGDNIIYEQSCGICGSDMKRGIPNKWERKIINRKTWNDWVKYKTDSDYWI